MMSHFTHTLCPLPILLYSRTLDNEKLFYHRFFRSALATFLHVGGVDGGVRAYTPYQYQQRDFFLSIKYLTTQKLFNDIYSTETAAATNSGDLFHMQSILIIDNRKQ